MAYSTINKSTDYFNTKLYTGTGSSLNVTGVGFQPDFTWIKQRTGTTDHILTDAVRGVTKSLNSNDNSADDTISNALTAFGTDGFTVGGNSATGAGSGSTYASWNWLGANGTASNTDGSITSTVSANTTAGFSIVSWTGTGANATVGHGLGSAAKMIIAKNLDSSGASAEHWTVFHHTLDTNKNLYLNLGNAEDTPSPEIYREGSFTNDVFAIGAHDRINKSGEGMIAYCFAEVPGYSKFGSYTGNGNADGTFVYTGFKPAFVILKNTSAVQDWSMKDNKRPGYNVTDDILYPNGNYAEGSGGDIDIISNGFKIRTTAANTNGSGNTFIYMAFGQSLVGSNNVPCTAR